MPLVQGVSRKIQPAKEPVNDAICKVLWRELVDELGELVRADAAVADQLLQVLGRGAVDVVFDIDLAACLHLWL